MFLWFIILIVLFFLFFKIKEGFKSDYSDYNSIDRIKVDDKFAYCIGSKPICNTGSPIKGGVYGNSTTYSSHCDDGSTMVCNNFIKNNLDISGDNYIWKTPNNTSILFSQTYKGFTEPTSYIPAIINDNNIDFYLNNKIIDSINKCSLLGLDENKCKTALNIPIYSSSNPTNSNSYDISLNEFNNSVGYLTDSNVDDIGDFLPTYTQSKKSLDPRGFSGMYPNLPCVADYGSLPGDNICNGEIGLLEDPGLICPYNKPICNYQCGSKFGTCNYSN